jgi:hypothetical protein
VRERRVSSHDRCFFTWKVFLLAQRLDPKNFHLAWTRFMADPLDAAGGK